MIHQDINRTQEVIQANTTASLCLTLSDLSRSCSISGRVKFNKESCNTCLAILRLGSVFRCPSGLLVLAMFSVGDYSWPSGLAWMILVSTSSLTGCSTAYFRINSFSSEAAISSSHSTLFIEFRRIGLVESCFWGSLIEGSRRVTCRNTEKQHLHIEAVPFNAHPPSSKVIYHSRTFNLSYLLYKPTLKSAVVLDINLSVNIR